MSIYANIKFEMKDGHNAPKLGREQQGNFRDVIMELMKEYYNENNKEWNSLSAKVVLSQNELEKFAKKYVEQAKHQLIYVELDYSIKHVDVEQFNQLKEKDIQAYHVEDVHSAFMPSYNQFEDWAYVESEDEIKENLPIMKKYIQDMLEGKLFFGVAIENIKSVELELL